MEAGGQVVRLSALVCVRGGESGLADCLRGLSFCDEVVLVVDRGADGVRDLARRAGAKVVDGIFPLPSQARAAGAEVCTGDWILEVEPDERVDRALAWEIRAALQMRPGGDWFDIPIDNYVGTTLVRQGWTGTLSARRAARLFRRGVKTWGPGRLGRASLSGAPAGALTGALRRSLGRDTGELVERANRQAQLWAEDAADAGRRRGLAAALLAGTSGLLDSYVARGGWREGRLGVLVALLTGLHPVLAQLRAAEILTAEAQQAPAPTAPLRRAG